MLLCIACGAIDDDGAACYQVLEEFYCNLKTVGVSAVTGENIDEFFTAVQASADDYLKYYKPELDRKLQVSGLWQILQD